MRNEIVIFIPMSVYIKVYQWVRGSYLYSLPLSTMHCTSEYEVGTYIHSYLTNGHERIYTSAIFLLCISGNDPLHGLYLPVCIRQCLNPLLYTKLYETVYKNSLYNNALTLYYIKVV